MSVIILQNLTFSPWNGISAVIWTDIYLITSVITFWVGLLLTSLFCSHFHSKASSPLSHPPAPRSESPPHPYGKRRLWGRSHWKSDWKTKRSFIWEWPRWGRGGWTGGRKLPEGHCSHRDRCGQTRWAQESAEITQGADGQREGQRTKCVLFWWCHNLSFWSGMVHLL